VTIPAVPTRKTPCQTPGSDVQQAISGGNVDVTLNPVRNG